MLTKDSLIDRLVAIRETLYPFVSLNERGKHGFIKKSYFKCFPRADGKYDFDSIIFMESPGAYFFDIGKNENTTLVTTLADRTIGSNKLYHDILEKGPHDPNIQAAAELMAADSNFRDIDGNDYFIVDPGYGFGFRIVEEKIEEKSRISTLTFYFCSYNYPIISEDEDEVALMPSDFDKMEEELSKVENMALEITRK